MSEEAFSYRLYPIGAFPDREVADIRMDPLCADKVGVDELLSEWRLKSEAFRALPTPSLDVTDSDLLPLNESQGTLKRIERLLASYRAYLPATYKLAMVPISKLVCPQKYVELEYVRAAFGGLDRTLTDEENAEQCLAIPVRDLKLEATFLGYENTNYGSNESTFLYQFSSDDNNMRFLPAMPLKPVQDVDLAIEGSPERYDAKAVAVSVGPGLSFVHVMQVPVWIDPATRNIVYRLIISNGVHRIFRLAELKNTHVAALVQTIDRRDIPDPYVGTARDALFSPGALRLHTMVDPNVSRAFKWKKARRVLKLRVKVVQDLTFVP